MVYKIFFISVSILLFSERAHAGECLKNEVKIDLIERLNDHLFEMKTHIDVETKKTTFYIDDVEVDEDSFYLQQAHAHIEENKELQKLKEQRYTQALINKNTQRLLIYKKLIKQLIEEYIDQNTIIKNCKLEPFFVYSSSTIEDENKIEEIKKSLVCAQALCQNDEGSVDECERVYDLLDKMFDSYTSFVQASLANAIKSCNDTEQLKSFLRYISGE